MRKRRNLIIALLLVVAMVAGIGYAALAKDLPITGEASLSKDNVNWAVVYTRAEVTSITVNGATAAPADALAKAGQTGNAATYTINGLAKEGDVVVFEYTIENQSEAVANLGTITSVLGTCTGGDTEKYFTTKVEIKRGDKSDYQTLTFNSEGKATAAEAIALDPHDTDGSDGHTDELYIQVTVTLNQTVGVEAGTADDTITLAGAKVNFNFTSDVATP